MTKEEAYSEGWHTGRLFAEQDIRNHASTNRVEPLRQMTVRMPESRAWHLGVIRGYRDTVARFDAGEYTWEMFETTPLGT